MAKRKQRLLALALVLSLALAAGIPAAFALQGGETTEAAFERELQQAREIYYNSAAPAAQDLVPIYVDDSEVVRIHPGMEEEDGEIFFDRTDWGDDRWPGPFDVGDTRLFKVMLNGASSVPETDVMARLIAQTAHTNVWVLDDDSYHYSDVMAGTKRTVNGFTIPDHDTDCHLSDLEGNVKIAQNLGNAFDLIYTRMTNDFGPHIGTAADKGNDGKLNFVLYDIAAVNTSGRENVTGFFWTGELSTNILDAMHIDCAYGWGSLNAGESSSNRLSLYGTLAHEFQHFLYYNTLGTSSPSWLNESLSELAGVYYTLEGAEIASYTRMRRVADNTDTRFDYTSSSVTLQQYGRGRAFGMQNYKRFPDYAKNIYAGIKAASPYSGTNAQVGAILQAATGINLEQHMILFGESLAADGGTANFLNGASERMVKIQEGTWEDDNLWALRAAMLGQGSYSSNLYAVRVGENGTQWIPDMNPATPTNGLGAITVLPTGTSAVSLPNAYQEKVYRLTDGSLAAPILDISVNEINPTTRYYIAAVNNASPAPVRVAGASGADIYELKRDGNPNLINVNGRPTYLIVVTAGAAATGTGHSVTYSWGAPAANALVGTVSPTPLRPIIGNTVTANASVAGVSDLQYEWFIGDAPAPGTSNTATYVIPNDGQYTGQVLTVKVTSPTKNGNALFGSTTVIGKKTASAPTQPTVEDLTSTTVTLEELPADAGKYEYSQGGVIWQSSPAFTHLLPDTDYYFYRRLKATDDTAASPASPASLVARTLVLTQYGITLDKSGTYTFAGATYGYTTPPTATVQVNNIGTVSTGGLTAALSGTNANSFALTGASIASIAAGGSSTFSVVPVTGLAVGTYTATVTVSGGANITAQSFDVSFTVNKATPAAIVWPTAGAINYGQALSASALTGGSATGTFAWTTGATVPTVTNSGYSVTFTPADTANYDWSGVTLTGTVGITVNKAAPAAIAWPTAGTITYGQTLSASALTGGSATGTFAWTTGGTLPTVSNTGYEVTFTPTDTANYDWSGVMLTNTVSIAVSKATPAAIVWPTAGTITYGQALSASALTGGSATGAFAWTTGTTIPTVSNTGYEVTFAPADTANYDWSGVTLTGTVGITVNKAIPAAIIWPVAGPITLGQALSASTLTGGSATGTFAWANDTIVPAALGDSGYSVIFTPADTANYDWSGVTLTDTVTVTVNDKTPVGIIVTMNGKTYDGQPCAWTGTPAVTNLTTSQPVTGLSLNALYESTDGAGYSSAAAPSDAGAYRLTLSVPGSNPTYSGSGSFTFTIAQKQIVITADNKSVKQNSGAPAYTCTVAGLVPGQSLVTLPTAACPTANLGVAGDYPIVPSGAAASANYTISYQNGKLTVTPLSAAKDIAGISVPAGAARNGTAFTASVASGVGSLTVAITTSADATWKLYSDAACANEIPTRTVNLAVGANTVYIRVTAEDGTAQTYSLTITRAQPKGIFGTNAKWYGAWWHYLLFFFLFGFIWMWF